MTQSATILVIYEHSFVHDPVVNTQLGYLPFQRYDSDRVFIGASQPQDAIKQVGRTQVVWLPDFHLQGNAGCLRNLLADGIVEMVGLWPMGYTASFSLSEVFDIHKASGGPVSVFAPPENPAGCSGVFVLDASIIEHIPDQGYWDVQENLIPELVILGKAVNLVELPAAIHGIHVASGDTGSLEGVMESVISGSVNMGRLSSATDSEVFLTGKAKVDAGACFYGQTILMDDVYVPKSSTVLGPAIIESGVRVEPGSVVSGIVSSDQHENCHVNTRCSQPWGLVGIVAGLISLLGVFLWSYSSTIGDLWQIWLRNDEYSSGLLVPFLAGYVLWGRRSELRSIPIASCIQGGVFLLLVAAGIRLGGTYYYYGSLERASVVIAFSALVLWFLGTDMVKKTIGVLLFLFMMLPWPNRVQAMITLPLQRWATSSAVFLLELFGYPVLREGNVITIGETRVAVAEACNGLRMITAFFVIGALVALLSKRTWWEKLLILLSCLPIALICNTVRLVITSIAFTKISSESWETLFHDFGGYAMMPLALGLVIVELYVLGKLMVSEDQNTPDLVVRAVEC